MFVVKNKGIFVGISIILVLASLFAIYQYGLVPSIDFSGGVLMEVSYVDARPEISLLNDSLKDLDLGNYSLRPAGENTVVLRSKELDQNTQGKVLEALSLGNKDSVHLDKLNTVGPSIGAELARKAIVALILVVLVIIAFITFAFRKVSKPVSSWKYGLVAIVALVHDVIIPTGLFAVLGHYIGYEVDTLFITALLAILGYSVSDTIVVFDRIRENLKTKEEDRGKESFADTVGKSLSETYGRSFNTSFTTFLALTALYFLGPVSTEHFALTLLVGIIAGTYSSICLASPLLVMLAGEGESN